MKKTLAPLLAFCLALSTLLAGCDPQANSNPQPTFAPIKPTYHFTTDPVRPDPETGAFQTLDEGVEWYLQDKESAKYLKGDKFFYAYRIVDIIESPDATTVYVLARCIWVNIAGQQVSGMDGPMILTFTSDVHGYYFMEMRSLDGAEFLDYPQNVLDAYKNKSSELYNQVENAIADWLAEHH